jgi:hypothetical protein
MDSVVPGWQRGRTDWTKSTTLYPGACSPLRAQKQVTPAPPVNRTERTADMAADPAPGPWLVLVRTLAGQPLPPLPALPGRKCAGLPHTTLSVEEDAALQDTLAAQRAQPPPAGALKNL